MENIRIVTEKPVITFPGYEDVKKQAQKVADHINSLVVTDENVAEVKQSLADARKIIKEIDNRRIAIKKEILTPYDEFAEKVKEITNIIDAADDNLRTEVRKMEERRRAEKEQEIINLWKTREWMYPSLLVLTDAFNAFLKSEYLNKSTPMKKIETEMIEFMERTDSEFDLLAEEEYADEMIHEYKMTFDLAESIKAVKDRHKSMEEVAQTMKQEEDTTVQEEEYKFSIHSGSDAMKVIDYMNSNNINYSIL